jgi:hypothetical protein
MTLKVKYFKGNTVTTCTRRIMGVNFVEQKLYPNIEITLFCNVTPLGLVYICANITEQSIYQNVWDHSLAVRRLNTLRREPHKPCILHCCHLAVGVV